MSPSRPTVAVIGAGAGGIAAGVRLKRAGYEFTIYEGSDGFGGTWRQNTYPGAACDVPSHFYSFSFDLNPYWSRTFAPQPEILAYLERCAARAGLGPHLRPLTTIETARWSDDRQRWTLTDRRGDEHTAEVVVSGLGMLNVPHVPEIPGAARFAGRAFHSSNWDHTRPLTGERVASIGTGASAVQYVPEIAPEVEHLTVFQRSPVWIAPRIDHEYTDVEQRRFARRPGAARRHRWQIWLGYERASFRTDSDLTAFQTGFARSYLERKVTDPGLRAQLTPDYPVGCKRPLFSRSWYPALTRPNVRLVTEAITRLTERGIHTADGEEHPVDTIIYGTGFRASEYLTAVDFYGSGGRRLHDEWRDGAEAYLGLTVAGYPNLFLLYGPNTNGVTSVLFMHEAQVNYLMSALRTLRRRRFASVDVKRAVMDRYNRDLQLAMEGLVWTEGCHNYFRAPNGKVVTQLPMSGARYWARTRFCKPWEYERTSLRRVPEATRERIGVTAGSRA